MGTGKSWFQLKGSRLPPGAWAIFLRRLTPDPRVLYSVALFRTRSAAVYGIEAHVIDVEVDMYNGSARDFVTVEMPDTAVARVASASNPPSSTRVLDTPTSQSPLIWPLPTSGKRVSDSICPWPLAFWAPWAS
jgi:hypothetical protein